MRRRGDRLDGWVEESLCSVCPAQVLGFGEFDVADRPGRDSQYHPQAGYRVDRRTLSAVCVHPFRVGLPPAAYASGGAPLPVLVAVPPVPAPVYLELPGELTDLEGWFVAVLRTADPPRVASALARAEATASSRFPPGEVLAALRRVLSIELARLG